MRWLREVWRETPRGLRVLWLVLWGVGAVLLGSGWWGDQAGFWSSKPFLTNVFSSLTAALFGVPLALVVLQRIGLAQAEVVEARAARRLAAKAAADLARAVRMLYSGPPDDVREVRDDLLSLERAAQDAIRRWDGTRDEESLSSLHEFLIDGTIERVLADFRSVVQPGRRAVPAVAEISAHWSFLDSTIRGRVLETGGTWLAPPVAARLTESVRRLAADPYLDGWLRDVDMANRRLRATSDLSADLRDLWTQLEIGYEIAEAVSLLDDLTAEASRVLGSA